jgi:hypothetical protein
MTILEGLRTNIKSTIFFIIFSLCIIFFTNLTIDKLFVLLALVAAGIIIYNTALSSPSLLIIGLVGIIAVLLFSLATGVGRSEPPIVIKQDCKPKRIQQLKNIKNSSLTCPASKLDATGLCPMGYTNFTDAEGNTLCCASSNIDPYSHKCPASGPNGICAMAPGLEDIRSSAEDKKFYPLCQNVRYEQIQKKGLDKCPAQLPHYLQMQGSSAYKCCATHVTSDQTKCPDPNNSCSSLFGIQTVFNSSDSCEAMKFQNSLKCPIGTNLNKKQHLTDPKTKLDIFVPACNGPSNICYPRAVLEKCIELGTCSKLNIDKSLSNCEIYDKLFNKRSIEFKDVDITPVNFFS